MVKLGELAERFVEREDVDVVWRSGAGRTRPELSALLVVERHALRRTAAFERAGVPAHAE